MKKILLFAAAAFVAASASAATVVDKEFNLAGLSGLPGWASDDTKPKLSCTADGIVVNNPEATTNFWDVQFQIGSGLNLVEGTEYTVTAVIKTNATGNIHLAFGDWSSKPVESDVIVENGSSDWQTLTYKAVASASMNNAFGLMQSGHFVGEYTVKSVTVSHEGEGGETPEDPAGKTLDVLSNLSNDAYDAATKTITFSKAWDWINWWYGEGDFSEYDSFVLEFQPVSYTVQVMIQYNEGEDQAVQAQAGESKLVVPLDAARKNSIKQIAIQNSEAGSLILTAAYFAASAGVKAVSANAVNNGVYNLQGVKVANSLDEVAAPGLYISNGKKIIKK